MTSKKKAAKKAAKKVAKKALAKKAAKKAAKSAPAKKVTKKAPAQKTANSAPAKKVPANKNASRSTVKSSAKKAVAKASSGSSAAPSESARTKPSSAKPTKAAKKAPLTTTVSKPKTPTIPKEFKYLHDKKWLAQQRELLVKERSSYTSSAERLAAEAAALMADREPGDVQFDEESGEGDTIAVERDRDLALSAAARQSVAEIDAALERLDNGTYGICVVGGDIIPQERLEAIPEAAVCVMHKTSMF